VLVVFELIVHIGHGKIVIEIYHAAAFECDYLSRFRELLAHYGARQAGTNHTISTV